MKVKVMYRMSDKWAREQLLATGEEHSTKREVELDLVQLTPEEREIVLAARSNNSGNVDLATYSDGGHSANYTTAPDKHELEVDTDLSVVEIIEAIRARVKSEQVARAAIRERQAAEYAREVAAKVAREQAEATRQQVQDAQQKAEEDQIATWVSQRGTPNQQARYAASLLPRVEVLGEIEAAAYAGLDSFSRYAPLTGRDVAHIEGCDEDRLHFSSEAADEATADEWNMMEAIRAAAPAGAVIELRTHRGQCQGRGCDLDAYRTGVKVTLTVGAFKFSREYAAAD